MGVIKEMFVRLSAGRKEPSGKVARPTGMSRQFVRRQVSQAKRDIRDWKTAERRAMSPSDPRFYLLQDLYREIMNDALLSSQIGNRIGRTLGAPFELVDAKGRKDRDAAENTQLPGILTAMMRYIVEARFYGSSLVEILEYGERNERSYRPVLISRRNVDAVNGRFFPDTQSDNHILYREMPDYGTWILEFGGGDDLGLLNKAVPHVLFKKFAQSCWSELCEIYGVPPRYLKTNTTDPEMLARGEQMMRDMGHAAAFVIDSTEEFQFAQGVTTKGEVYENLIRLCNQEISMLVSGAVIGQDTQNGNYSKEQASIGLLELLVAEDQAIVTRAMNEQVLPALTRLKLIRPGLTFRFVAAENPERLWEMVTQVLPYKDVDSRWLEEKFGIPVTDKSLPEPEDDPKDPKASKNGKDLKAALQLLALLREDGGPGFFDDRRTE